LQPGWKLPGQRGLARFAQGFEPAATPLVFVPRAQAP